MVDDSMVVLYLILYNIPFSILRYYPFVHKLRIPLRRFLGIYAVILLIQIITFFYLYSNDFSNLQLSQDFRIKFIFIYLLLSFLVIKENVFKHFFVYLMMFAYSAIVCDTAYIIETVSSSYLDTPVYFITNIAILVQILISYPFVFRFLKKELIPLLEMGNTDVWKYIWIIPMIFIAFAVLFGIGLSKEMLMNWRHYIVRCLVGLSFFSIYFILVKVMEQTKQNATLYENIRMTNNLLAVQSNHYKMLTDNNNKAKAARHDLRHHILVLQSFLQNKELSRMEEYLNQYQVRLSESEQPSICKHYMIDAILQHYRAIAESFAIEFKINVSITDQVLVDDFDLCIILGNILENAIEACERMTKNDKSISLHIKMVGNMLVITLDNSYDGRIKVSATSFVSSKRSGGEAGMGLASIQSIVSKYKGVLDLKYTQDIFKTSIMLNLPHDELI